MASDKTDPKNGEDLMKDLNKRDNEVFESPKPKAPKVHKPKHWGTHWKDLPAAIDMSCYADYYQQAVREMAARIDPNHRKVFVELGARFGCSARIIIDAIHVLGMEHWHMYLIDPVSSEYLVEVADDSRVEFWQNTAEASVGRFKDGQLALVHIDVDPHEYEQTKRIFEMYAPKVMPGGVVIFHDCSSGFGVHRFVTGDLLNMPGWAVDFCPEQPVSPISSPAKAVKL